MKHPTLFDNPPEPDANDPYRSPEPPQVQARRDGLRMAEPFQPDIQGHIIGALYGAPDGYTRAELAEIVTRKRGTETGEQSLCDPLKRLEESKRITTNGRRLGNKGVKVTVYLHARFKSD